MCSDYTISGTILCLKTLSTSQYTGSHIIVTIAEVYIRVIRKVIHKTEAVVVTS